MSHEARDWAWSIAELPAWVRIVLLALAEHVREGASCFPGQGRLAGMCSVSERQLRNALRELERRGLITIEHRPGEGGGRRSNVYRLVMGERQAASGCPQASGNPASGNRNCSAGQSETDFRNCGSEAPPATGNSARGNRNSSAGNRNPTSAEPEERTVRRKLRNTPPYPPKGGTRTGEESHFAESPRNEHNLPVTNTPDPAAPAGASGQTRSPPSGTAPPVPPQGSGRRTQTRRGQRNGTGQRLAEKDYTVGATRDEDLPDWARRWRDRADDES